MKNIKYIPIIDELATFILNRARAYKKRRLLKNKNIHSSVRIGNDCLIDKNVYIAEGTYIGGGGKLYAGVESKIEIGKYCAIGYNVHIKARSHDLKRPTSTGSIKHLRVEKDIKIGDFVWIGDNVFVKEGVSIASHAVIAANSVVVKNVKEKEIVGGVPAKHIRINNSLIDTY
jgi:maltose O-acetyltransferase